MGLRRFFTHFPTHNSPAGAVAVTPGSCGVGRLPVPTGLAGDGRRLAVSGSMDAFDRITGQLNYPMFVVTTRFGDERAGCLVGFSSQVSIHPARFLAGLSKRNHTYRTAERGATHLAVHLLNQEAPLVGRLFGNQTDDRADKFAHCSWWDGPEGVPILSGRQAGSSDRC